MLDTPDDISRKVRRAETDSGNEIVYDPDAGSGVSNLLGILAACTGRTPDDCADGLRSYGDLKSHTAEAVIETLRPVQERYRELERSPDVVTKVLQQGAEKAQPIATATLERARRARGLLAI